MQVKRGLLLVAVLVLMGTGGDAFGETGILIDASRSMNGFFATKSIHELYGKIHSAIEEEQRAYFFKSDRDRRMEELVPYGADVSADGQVTRIDVGYEEMLSRHPQLDALWLITDNIQDPEGDDEEQGDINSFYDKLRSEWVKRISLFPLSFDFRGKIYNREGNQSIGRYSGRRGIIVYALLFNPAREKDFIQSVERAAGHLKFPRGDGILAKPIERAIDVIDVTESELGIGDESHLVLRDGPDGKELTSERIFFEGERLYGEFVIEFQSHLKHVSLHQPEVSVEPLESFALSDFEPDDPMFSRNPPQLMYKLSPGARSDAIKISIEFPKGVLLSSTPRSLVRNMFRSEPGLYSGRIKVGLKVTKRNLALVEDIKQQYSTTDPEYFDSLEEKYQTRIFGLEKLFSDAFLKDEVVETDPKVYTVHFRVGYPGWQAVVLPFAALLGLIALWGVPVMFLSRSQMYRLESCGNSEYRFWREVRTYDKEYDEETYGVDDYDDVLEGEAVPLSILESLTRGGYPVFLDDRVAANIKRSLRGPFVKTVKGFTVDGLKERTLPTRGETIFVLEVQRSDQERDHTEYKEPQPASKDDYYPED